MRTQIALKVLYQILEINLPLQILLEVISGMRQQRSAPLVGHIHIRIPRLNNDILAAFEGTIHIRLYQQLIIYRRRKVSLKPYPQSLGQCAQNDPHPGRVRRLQKPPQDAHCREVKAGDSTEVQQQTKGTRNTAQGLSEMIGQRTHTAKKEIAAQPVCLHPLSLLQ